MRWSLFLPVLVLAGSGRAQELPATPSAPQPAPAAIAGGDAPTAPDLIDFGDDGVRMTVPVSVGHAGPYRFVIDTGAQRTVISRELAGTLGLPAGPMVRVMGMAGAAEVGTVLIPSIGVGSLSGQRIEAPALSGSALGAPGMLGIDTLQGHTVLIDFDTHSMAVVPSTKRQRREDRLPDEIVITARSQFGELIVTDATCDGQRVRVILDTGSVVSMGNLALRRRLARHPAVPIQLVSVTGDTLTADYTAIDRIAFGGVLIGKLPIAYADAQPFRRFGLIDRPAIMLGMDALAMFRRVQIDFANHQVRLALPRGTRMASRDD